MGRLISRFAEDETGATAIEYALIAALVCVVCLTAFTAFGAAGLKLFNGIASRIEEALGA